MKEEQEVLFDDANGTSRSVRHHCKQASRGVLHTVIQLIESFLDESALEGNVGAQRTGAVWSTCNTILQKKIPVAWME